MRAPRQARRITYAVSRWRPTAPCLAATFAVPGPRFTSRSSSRCVHGSGPHGSLAVLERALIARQKRLSRDPVDNDAEGDHRDREPDEILRGVAGDAVAKRVTKVVDAGDPA